MSQETRRELADRLLRFVGEINDDDTREIVNDLIASAVLSIWLEHPFRDFVMPIDPVVTTVVGQPLYVLPTMFGRVATKDGVLRNLTTGARIRPAEGADLERKHPEIGGDLDTTTADPDRYAIQGKVGINVQVATTGEHLEAVSDQAADVNVLLEVEGYSGDQWQTLQFTLNGTNPVDLGTWTYVQTIAKSYRVGITPTTALTSSAGTVTVRVSGAGATRQTLLPYESSREQFQLRLFHTPQSVQRIGVPTIRLPRRIFQDSDPIPAAWGPAVFEWAHVDYRVNTGELSQQAAEELHQQGTAINRLIGYDNEFKAGTPRRKRAFGG